MPLLDHIAHLDWFPLNLCPSHLLPDTVIYHGLHQDRIVFRVVDYRTNHSTSFPVDVDAKIGSIEVFICSFHDVENELLIIYFVDIRDEDGYYHLL